MKTNLGRAEDGRLVDLANLMTNVCLDQVRLRELIDNQLATHPEWSDIAQGAVSLYCEAFSSVPASVETHESAKSMHRPVSDVVRANAISALILLGVSHYLHWEGLNIADPVDFPEISVKLVKLRNGIAFLGFSILDQGKATSTSIPNQSLCCREGFSLGLVIGLLIADAHLESPTVSSPFLSPVKRK